MTAKTMVTHHQLQRHETSKKQLWEFNIRDNQHYYCTRVGNMRMVIEILHREGGNLLFSTQNLQDWSECAKNRAPDRSRLVIDVRILVWSKSRSELGDTGGGS